MWGSESLEPQTKKAPVKTTEGLQPFRASLLMTLMCLWPPHYYSTANNAQLSPW